MLNFLCFRISFWKCLDIFKIFIGVKYNSSRFGVANILYSQSDPCLGLQFHHCWLLPASCLPFPLQPLCHFAASLQGIAQLLHYGNRRDSLLSETRTGYVKSGQTYPLVQVILFNLLLLVSSFHVVLNTKSKTFICFTFISVLISSLSAFDNHFLQFKTFVTTQRNNLLVLNWFEVTSHLLFLLYHLKE